MILTSFPFLFVLNSLLLLSYATKVSDRLATLYRELGLEATDPLPSLRQVRSAYRALSKKAHPDVAGSGAASRDRWAAITKAHDILSDPKKRRMYSIMGDEGVKLLEKKKEEGNRGGAMEAFSFFFGGGEATSNLQGREQRSEIGISLKDVYSGAVMKLSLERQEVCQACGGTGAEGGGTPASNPVAFHQCGTCKGRGVVIQRIQLAPGFVQQSQTSCPHCGGTGHSISRKCPVCHGGKVSRASADLTLRIPRGAPEGHEIRYPMEADQVPGKIPGDVVIILKTDKPFQTAPGVVFRRDPSAGSLGGSRNDAVLQAQARLLLTIRLTLKQALLGFSITVPHLDGKPLALEAPEGTITPFGTVRVVKGAGLPIYNVEREERRLKRLEEGEEDNEEDAEPHFGDLHVTYEFDIPRMLTQEQRDALEEVFPMPTDTAGEAEEGGSIGKYGGRMPDREEDDTQVDTAPQIPDDEDEL